MHSLNRFKLLAVAAVLIALLTAVGGLVISQAAGGGSGIQATVYDDAVRFTVQNDKVAVLRAEVFNLSGKRLYDSGPVMGNALDWNTSTEAGERAAHGVYLYVITAWDSGGELVKSQVGKLALVPGGVGLGAAPLLVSEAEGKGPVTPGAEGNSVRALAVDQDHSTESWAFKQVGIGMTSPNVPLEVMKDTDFQVLLQRSATSSGTIAGNNGGNARFMMGVDANNNAAIELHRGKTGYNQGWALYIDFAYADDVDYNARFIMTSPTLLQLTGSANFAYAGLGNFGIGTTNPQAKLEVKGSTTNLLVLKDPVDNTVFRVEKDGDVYADRSYNCGLASGCFNTGSGADVAERIDVSEAVEPGDVVEIDPANPGLYRKAQEPYSTRVAGVISTAPAITLGNNFDAQADKWTDSRPLLALAGRVPVKVTTENGPIKVGDFLTTSSTPGYAMRCDKLARCTGAILGKALEPLEEGTGVIMAQVTLR